MFQDYNNIKFSVSIIEAHSKSSQIEMQIMLFWTEEI